MEFNIEEYLNLLPLDTTEINVSRKGLTYLPDLSRFKQLTHLYCSDNQLTWLPHLNNNLTHLNCSSNQLTGLPPLNNTLTRLYCSSNPLTELPPLNNTLTHLSCCHNQLTELPPLNNTLTYLFCSYNQLTWLPPLNNKLLLLVCFNNNIFNKNIKSTMYGNTNIIQTLRNFRYTYYLLKFKKHFKRWLWEKVREPKIMARFHPSHLDGLEETDDLEVFLEDWIKK
jgi:Leucine-rich repeat (LRR) protein